MLKILASPEKSDFLLFKGNVPVSPSDIDSSRFKRSFSDAACSNEYAYAFQQFFPLSFLSFCTYIRQRIDQWASSSPNRFNSLSLASFFDIRTPFESVSDREKSYVSFLGYIRASLRNDTFSETESIRKNRYFSVTSKPRFLSTSIGKKGRRIH